MGIPITMLRDGLLEKRASWKVTKSQWGLVVGVNATIAQIKKALASIPDEAKIIDEEEYESDNYSMHVNSVKNGTVYIFEVVKEDKIDE